MRGTPQEQPIQFQFRTPLSREAIRGATSRVDNKVDIELIAQYKRALKWIAQAAEDGGETIVLERLDDPNTTWTLHNTASTVEGESNSCWKIRSSTVKGLWLPTLTDGAQKILQAEHRARQEEKRGEEWRERYGRRRR